MRLPVFLALAAAPLLLLAAACVDGATPDCTKPNSGCVVTPPAEASAEAGDGSTSDAASDATDAGDALQADAGDAGDAGDAKKD